MHTVYHALVLAKVKDVIEQARALKGVQHQGLKGNLRETLIRELFRPLLPPGMGAGTGEIITAGGQTSRQQDVVIFDQKILPPILYEGVTGIFPVESVLYAIEIKSQLTNQELEKAHENAKALLDLEYQPGFWDRYGQPVGGGEEKLRPAVFAFDTDLGQDSQSELERYKRLLGAEQPGIVDICVVGKGYWYRGANENQWQEWASSYPYEEVIGFMASVMSTLSGVFPSRGFPLLGRYLLG